MGGRGPSQDTTIMMMIVELQDTHGGSSGGGSETELLRIPRAGVYALLDQRILLSRVTRLSGEGRRASTVGWVEGSGGGDSEPDRAGRRPSYSVVGFFLPTISRCISDRNVLSFIGIETLPSIVIRDPSYTMDRMNTLVTYMRPSGKPSPVSKQTCG